MTPTDAHQQFLGYAQQHWKRDSNNVGGYSALFAGHRARIQYEVDGAWYLIYLGFRSTPQVSVKEAEQMAPTFVRAVLAHMTSLIVDSLGEPI
ncbi:MULTISPECIES: hypothetical protein [unclassified Burkholderia]|uniref:hypothetical protein n=1 Tax=unclassified Burkholderia TaxID=2613784 RepID=UPI0014243B54|nr:MULTISPECIES: hypothetical protein [unclassified Burkholderia]NIE82509.1 hypothetical protein [Burkholderia sp. Tr-860]NIF61286.1 hypothetical protein [Burkholderia sp. Cy-647]NIF94491.1 hypothetical protein [Burkholderia sp. Ax-1720]